MELINSWFVCGWVGALASYGGALYLSGGERALMRLPLHRRDAPTAPVPHLARLFALLPVAKVARDHPCWSGGGEASAGACGPAPGACGAGGACGCALRCAPPPACAPHHLACSRAPRCIPAAWRCDGTVDCPDGSDEGPECGSCVGGLRCADGSCAAALGACAAGAYCAAPLPAAFRCDQRLCLAPQLLCDGRLHCEDGSDELPSACGYGQKEPTVSAETVERRSRALAVCGALGCAGAGVVGAWAALRRCRRARARPPPARPLVALKPPPPRSRPLGASCFDSFDNCATKSLCERYPRPTANPPPSPAKASSGNAGSGAGAGQRRAYCHYRAMNRPPPPTPASTDACESEPEPAASAPPPSSAPLAY